VRPFSTTPIPVAASSSLSSDCLFARASACRYAPARLPQATGAGACQYTIPPTLTHPLPSPRRTITHHSPPRPTSLSSPSRTAN
jgi:hypothetical protein